MTNNTIHIIIFRPRRFDDNSGQFVRYSNTAILWSHAHVKFSS